MATPDSSGYKQDMYSRARRRSGTFEGAEKKVLHDKVASAAGIVKDKVKSGAEFVDSHVPGQKVREKHREKRADKKGQKAYEKSMKNWNMRYYDVGSKEYERHIDELCLRIMGEQKSFVDYTTDMSAWKKKTDARKELDARNEFYCRNMFDYCISPLQHGISAESVVDTIGLYVGMSILSKDFRDTIGSELQRLAMPVRDRLGNLAAEHKDKAVAKNLRKARAIEEKYGHEFSSLELCDPPVLLGHNDPNNQNPKLQWARDYISKHYEGENADKHQARMQAKAEEIAMAKNHGRLPLNAETAALQRLNFMHNYYEQSRDPKATPEQLAQLGEDYKSAIGMLDTLMKEDGVDREDMSQCFRTIVGQLTAVYPEYECEFDGLAFDEYIKADGKEASHPTPKLGEDAKVYTWDGEYVRRSNGKAFSGDFGPRKIMDVDEYILEAGKYFDGIFEKLDTADKAEGVTNSVWMEKVSMRFRSMMAADFAFLDAHAPLSSPRDVDKTFDGIVNSSLDKWREKYPGVVEELGRREHEAREERSRRRCDFGVNDVEDEGYGGPDYGG